MKKHVLFLIITLVGVVSHAQYDFLKESLKHYWTSAPSYLVVKVKTPSYEGEAVITSNDFNSYYSQIVKHLKEKKRIKLMSRDIKLYKCFIISDKDLSDEYYNTNQRYYVFKKIIVNDSVLKIAKKGIEFFIHTYFDDNGVFNPPPQYEPNDFYTIVKVMFDAGIQTGIGSEDSNYYIQDLRFYKKYENGKAIEYVYPETSKFIVPPEYRDNKNVK